MDSSFPKGPANFQDLFQWADYNTSILMDNDQAKQRFIDLLSSVDQVVLHEDFAGMGTCGAALATQFDSFKHAVAPSLSNK